MRTFTLVLVAAATLSSAIDLRAEFGVEFRNRANRTALRHAQMMPWHGNYAHTPTGGPLGLVVPPVANMQTKMGWGVSQSEMVPLYHQAYRAYPGDGGAGAGVFSATPNWPSHTDQFGVYYVRGPW